MNNQEKLLEGLRPSGVMFAWLHRQVNAYLEVSYPTQERPKIPVSFRFTNPDTEAPEEVLVASVSEDHMNVELINHTLGTRGSYTILQDGDVRAFTDRSDFGADFLDNPASLALLETAIIRGILPPQKAST